MRFLIYLSLAIMPAMTSAAGPAITRVSARDAAIDITISNPSADTIRIAELDSWQTCAASDAQALYEGSGTGILSFPRFDGNVDRLYRAFQLINASDGAEIGLPQFVTNLDGLSRLSNSVQGWTLGGAGGVLAAQDGAMHITFTDPGAAAFDPYFAHSFSFDPATTPWLVMRIRYTNPDLDSMNFGVYLFPASGGFVSASFILQAGPDWQVVAYDMRAASPPAGMATMRFDLAENQHALKTEFLNAVVDIDWIAITDNAAYDGHEPSAAARHWSFTDDRNFSFLKPDTIKGLQVQMADDAIELGVRHAGLNVVLSSVVDWGNASPSATWDVDGQAIPININYVAGLDSQVKQLTDAGCDVTLIMLNSIPTSDNGHPLIHPLTDLANAPNHLGAFNVTDQDGYRYYRAAVEFLAFRYSDPGRACGWASNFIVGNEVDAHWDWHNMGAISIADFMADYTRQVRIADLAVRKFHRDARALISMTHYWTGQAGSTTHSGKGRDVMNLMNTNSKAQGDFPWNIAYHPYPQNLFEPRFWKDNTATFTFNTKRITFKNIEILPVYMRQPGMLVNGEPHRIILSEQGFHTPSTTDGQDIQAAAYACAWWKLSHTPGIDAFILHRHVDHGLEGGLLLGLWTRNTSASFPAQPLAKKRSWRVFQAAGTPDFESEAAFALPIIGLSAWKEALPAATQVHFLFDTIGDQEGWKALNQVINMTVAGGFLQLRATGEDPYLSRPSMFLLGDVTQKICVRMRADAGSEAQLFWARPDAAGFAESRSRKFPISADGAFHLYTLDLSDHAEWTGHEITALRLDPTNAAGNIAVDFIAAPQTGADQDDDGLGDMLEGVDDPDGDGYPSFIDTDSDNDGLSDDEEASRGTNPTDADTDGDGVSDGEEVDAGTDPLVPNTNTAPLPVLVLSLVIIVTGAARQRRRLPV